MANLRYPLNVQSDKEPWMLFTTHRPQYNEGGRVNSIPTSNSVALYVPTNHAVSDSINYDTAQMGDIGTLINAWMRGGGVTGSDVAGVAARLAQRTGQSIVDAITPGVDVRAISDLTRGRVANPNEFMLFKAPSMRSFSFNFTMIPRSENEARVIPEIIKFFRKAAYPALASRIEYTFPDAFNITFGGMPTLIKLPELVCTGVTVTYNPTSISYFRVNNMPVETTLALTFQELQPISRELVDEGF